jgi:competence ComEA-like helix-hairpin-helix protein
MWKDWLAFSRKEQYGIILLVFLIFVFLLIRIGFSLWDEPPAFVEKHTFEDFFDVGKASESQERSIAIQYNFSRSFNPNKVNVTTLDKMGLPTFVVVNWMKYLEAGGRFHSFSDIKKIYGLDSVALHQMKPFVDFSDYSDGSSNITKQSTFADRSKSSEKEGFRVHNISGAASHVDDESLKIDINIASAEEFQEIRGIGDVYSNRIVAFRKLLGGFYTVDQIKEVYGISEELFNEISSNLELKNGPFRKIEVNHASLKELKKHPYINFYQARDIIECRKQYGMIEVPEVLKQYSSFDDKTFEKILPYFSFKEN